MRIGHISDTHWNSRQFDEIHYALEDAFAFFADKDVDVIANTGDNAIKRGYLDAKQIEGISWQTMESIAGARDLFQIDGNHDHNLDGTPSATQELSNVFDSDRVHHHSKPGWRLLGNPYDQVVMMMLPHFSRALYNPYVTTDLSKWELAEADMISDIIVLIQGYVAEIKRQYPEVPIVCLYHGSIAGAVLDNEQSLPAGMDLLLPASAFANIDLLLLGHLHRSQQVSIPDGVAFYAGAPIQHNFGERANVAWARVFDVRGDRVRVLEKPLDQRRYRVQMNFTNEGRHPDFDAFVDAEEVTDTIMEADLPANTHLKIDLQLPSDVLNDLDARWEAALLEVLPFYEMQVMRKSTDRVSKRISMKSRTFEQMLDEWMEVKSYDIATRQRVRKIAKLVNVEAGERIHDQRHQCTPYRMEVRNWKPFKKAVVEFENLNGLICWIGPNGAGKSNLIEAELFARYGINFKGGGLGDCVRHGTDSMRVDYQFTDIGGTLWKIQRTVNMATVKGQQVGRSGDLFLWYYELRDDVWIPATGNTKKETQEKIDELVGPSDFYLRTSFAGEDDLKALVRAKKSELLDLFQRMLGLDMEARLDAARPMVDKAGSELLTLDGALGFLESRSASKRPPQLPSWLLDIVDGEDDPLEMVQHTIHNLGLKTQEAEDEEEALATYIQENLDERVRLEAESAAVTERLRVVVDPSRRVTRIKTRIAGINEEARKAKEDLERIRDEMAGIELPRGGVSIATALASMNDVEDNLDRCREEERKVTVEVAQRRVSLSSDKSAIATLEHKLNKMMAQASLLTRVPCRGELWQQERPDRALETANMGRCPLLEDVTNLPIAQTEDELADMRELVEERSLELPQVVSSLEMVTEAIKKNEENLAIWKKHIEESEKYDRLESHEDDVEADIETFKADLIAAQEELDELLLQVHEHELLQRADVTRLGELKLQIDTNLEQGMALAANVAGVRVLLKDYGTRISQAEAAVALFKAMDEEEAERLTELKEVRSKIAEKQHDLHAMKLYQKAAGRDGIPYLMLEAMIPQFEEVVNDLLGPTDIGYSITTVRDTQAGDRIDAITQTFTDTRGEHLVAESSGFQSTILGMALRWGLAIVQSEMLGIPVNHFFQDEGFGSMSTENRLVAIDVMRRAAKRIGGTFHYITHIDEMVSAADQVCRIEALSDNTARVVQ